MDTRKRNRADLSFNTNGGFKKSKSELDPISPGIGSKSKACTKFFSVAGCPFGESCHFLHYVPGGYNAVAQMMNLPPAHQVQSSVPRNVPAPPLPHQNGSPALAKTKLCNKYNTAEGCKFGDKCHFAHGELELGKAIAPSPPHPMGGRFGARMEPMPALPGPVSSFGASATAKISVNASLAGTIIGKGGVNSKQICRMTGVKLSIREHETDPNQKSIELEGSFEAIQRASDMVREIISNIGPMGLVGGLGRGAGLGGGGAPPPQANNFKTKLCENFAKGSCTFGDRCHFAHGAAELRKSGV